MQKRLEWLVTSHVLNKFTNLLQLLRLSVILIRRIAELKSVIRIPAGSSGQQDFFSNKIRTAHDENQHPFNHIYSWRYLQRQRHIPSEIKMKTRLMKSPCRLVAAVAVSFLTLLTSISCFGADMTPLKPSHARLLDGRNLFIDSSGTVHVEIVPAPVVRLTDNLLSLTFAFPASEQEALEIAKFPHTGAIVQSERYGQLAGGCRAYQKSPG
jgi:hypothetical protein